MKNTMQRYGLLGNLKHDAKVRTFGKSANNRAEILCFITCISGFMVLLIIRQAFRGRQDGIHFLCSGISFVARVGENVYFCGRFNRREWDFPVINR